MKSPYTLYDIETAIEDCVDLETGEIIDFDRLEALQMERKKKIEGVACWVKDLAAFEKALKEEQDAIAAKRKATQKKIADLKAYLMEHTNGEKFQTPRCSIHFRKSERLEVEEGASVPDEFLKTTVTLDKAGLKEAVKAGREFPGVQIVEGQNIIIK